MSEKRNIRGDNVNRKSRDVNFFYESGCVEITFDHISVVWSDGNNKGNYIAYLSESLNRFTKNKKKLHKERHKTLQQTHLATAARRKKSDWQTASQKDYEHMEPTGNTEQCDHVHDKTAGHVTASHDKFHQQSREFTKHPPSLGPVSHTCLNTFLYLL